MEARYLLAGDITGEIFNDLNANGVRDGGEPAVQDSRVFIDTNFDGDFDAGEPFALSNAGGNYSIRTTGLNAGTEVVVRLDTPSALVTAPGLTVALFQNQSELDDVSGNDTRSRDIEAGDFNGDGVTDLAVLQEIGQGGRLAIFLANIDGTYPADANKTISLSLKPSELAVGDINGGGKDDLILVGASKNTVDVLADFDGTNFVSRTSPFVGALDVAMGNFDSDPEMEFAVLSKDAGQNAKVSVFQSTPGLSLSASEKILSGITNPGRFALGKFDSDQNLDVVFFGASSNRVTFLPGTGQATFGEPVSSTIGQRSFRSAIAAGNFDNMNPSSLDLALFEGSSIVLLRGDGNGSFSDTQTQLSVQSGEDDDGAPVPGNPNRMVAADMDGDGDSDLAVTSNTENGSSTVASVQAYENRGGGFVRRASVFQINVGYGTARSIPIVSGVFRDQQNQNGVNVPRDVPRLALAAPSQSVENEALGLKYSGPIVGGAYEITLTNQAMSNRNFGFQAPVNTAPTISTIADQTILMDGITEALPFDIGDNETEPSLLTIMAATSNATLLPPSGIVVAGSGQTRTVTLTPATGQFGSASITLTVSDGDLTASTTFVLTVKPDLLLRVSGFAATSTGFVATFNRPFDPDTLNLYATGPLGPTDVTVQGDTVGRVQGSLVFDDARRAATFIRTGGPLEPDQYTVTLRSATDGWRNGADQSLLDGDEDGSPGADFTAQITVAEPSATTVVASLPDFTRGYGQDVNIPASEMGIPLTISRGNGVSRVDLTLNYDRDLLTITAFTSQVPGTSVNFSPATGTLRVTKPTELTVDAGPLVVGFFTAKVSQDATLYGKHLLDIADLRVFDDGSNPVSLPAVDDDAVHIASFFGDANGSRSYNSPDATLAQRLIVQSVDGLPAFPLVDPRLITDITGNGLLQSNDTTSIQQVIVQTPIENVPPLPSGIIPPAPSGADPKLFIPRELTGTLGGTVVVPVRLEVTEEAGISISGADVAISYDPTILSVSSSKISLGSLLPGAILSANTSDPGIIRITSSSATGPANLPKGTVGELYEIEFQILASAASGQTPINLRAEAGIVTAVFDNDDLDELTLQPVPTNGDTDQVDGLLSVTIPEPTVSISVSPAAVVEDGSVTLDYTFIRSGDDSQELFVHYTIAGTAVPGSDYAALSGSVTIPAGINTVVLSIDPIDDSIVESDETIVLSVIDGANYDTRDPASVTGRITNDDQPSVGLSTSAVAINEDSQMVLTLTLALSAISDSDVTVPYVLTGTATNGVDFTISTSPLTIRAGEVSGSITLEAIDDGIDESTESVLLTLGTPVNATLGTLVQTTVSILDNEGDDEGRIIIPGIVARPSRILNDGRGTAILFKALVDTVLTVAEVGTTSLLIPRVQLFDENLGPVSITANADRFTAQLAAGGTYALIFEGDDVESLFVIRSSAGSNSLSGDVPTNLITPTDVNADGMTSALDALQVINEMGRRLLAAGETSPKPDFSLYYDVNADGRVSAADALRVINRLAQLPLAASLQLFVLTAENEDDAAQSVTQREATANVIVTRELKAASFERQLAGNDLVKQSVLEFMPTVASPDDIDTLFADEQSVEKLLG